jgi:Zn-finger protein
MKLCLASLDDKRYRQKSDGRKCHAGEDCFGHPALFLVDDHSKNGESFWSCYDCLSVDLRRNADILVAEFDGEKIKKV